MSDKTLYERLEKYFRGRSELVETPHYTSLTRAMDSAIDFLHQKILYDNWKDPKELEITLDHMLGYPEQRQAELEELDTNAKEIVAALYNTTPEHIEITGAYVMYNGSSKPIRLEFSLLTNGSHVDKTIFVKRFDENRLIGLELYDIFGGWEEDYSFAFNQGAIIEQKVEGKHEYDLPFGVQDQPHYVVERVKSDLFAFFTGCDDLGKKDNYLVTSQGRVSLIDFDVMDRFYNEDEIDTIKKLTAEELGITRDEYARIYQEQEDLLRDRISGKKKRLYGLIGVLEQDDDPMIKDLGGYIKRNTDRLLHQI